MTVDAQNVQQNTSKPDQQYIHTMTKYEYSRNAWVVQCKEINECNIFNSRKGKKPHMIDLLT